MQDFVHLHVHTQYSILDGQASIPRLVDKAIADGMKGIAVTDHGDMFGIKEFFNYVNKKNGGTNGEIKDLKKKIAGLEKGTVECENPEAEVLGNAGSFFMNPIITAEHFEKLKKQFPEIPSYPASEGKIKVPAGWLIEQCGFKGKNHGSVGVYEKQALVLVNLGDARGDEIALVAESIRTAVKDRFGIELMPEVKYVG